MAKTELTSSQQVEYVRSMVDGDLQHPINGEFFRQLLNRDIQSMLGFRVQKNKAMLIPLILIVFKEEAFMAS